MSGSTYVYKALDCPCKQIRLLTVLPARDNDSVIESRLTTHPIPVSNASRGARFRSHIWLPSYYAVSYVWGREAYLGKSHKIIVDGRGFPVTENVHALLHEFRSFNTAPFRLWIDSICINQADNVEKSDQIRIMREIYHLGLGVLVWLGSATPDSVRVMRFINDLSQPPFVNTIQNAVLELHAAGTKRKMDDNVSSSITESIRAEVLRTAFTWYEVVGYALVRVLTMLLDIWLNKSRDNEEWQDPLSRWILGFAKRIDGLSGQKRAKPKMEARWKTDMNRILDRNASWEPTSQCLRIAQREHFSEMAGLIEKTFISNTGYFHRMWTLQEASVGFIVIILLSPVLATNTGIRILFANSIREYLNRLGLSGARLLCLFTTSRLKYVA